MRFSLKRWENVIFEVGSERVKDKCISELVEVGRIINFHLGKLRKGSSSYCMM